MLASVQAEVEFRHRTFVLDDFTRHNISAAASCLTAENPKFGLIMCGTCGNGKTTLLNAIQSVANYLNDFDYMEDNTGIQILDAKEVAIIFKDAKAFDRIRKRDCLALEDIGRESAEILDYGNVLSPITDLLEYRYNAQLFTFITTNLTPKEIREKYGIRIADRFNEMMEVIVFENNSYRNKIL